MAKGSDNKFPKIIITEGSAPSNADSGDQKLYIDSSDHKLKRKNSSGTVVTIETAAGVGGSTGSTDNAIIRADGTGGATVQSSLVTIDDSGTVDIPTGQTYNINNTPHTHTASAVLLAVKTYAPASDAVYSTTSGTLADVDATNLAVTFTAPASGNVIVRLSAWCDLGATDYLYWSLRESTTNLGYPTLALRSGGQAYVSMPIYLTGISAGSHTYKWSFAISGAAVAGRIIVGDGSNFGPGVMEVWAAP